jgi:hypothetical protein
MIAEVVQQGGGMRRSGEGAAVDGIGFGKFLFLIQHDTQHALGGHVGRPALEFGSQDALGSRKIAALQGRHCVRKGIVVCGPWAPAADQNSCEREDKKT